MTPDELVKVFYQLEPNEQYLIQAIILNLLRPGRVETLPASGWQHMGPVRDDELFTLHR